MRAVHEFASRERASAAAAEKMATLIDARWQQEGRASVVVAGGTTPQQCFSLLSKKPLAWQDVQVALSDERWVASDHEDSNERLVREMLVKDAASAADVLPIYQRDTSPEARCEVLRQQLSATEFACALVGMGTDGHFASLFPDAENLATGLDLSSTHAYIPVRTGASPHPRVSMTLSALLRSDEILLLFFGEEKYRVYEQALAGDDSYPIFHLLQQQRVPVQIIWAV